MKTKDYEKRVQKLEDEGLTTGDAQAVVDAEIMLAIRKAAPEMHYVLELVRDQFSTHTMMGYSEEQRAVMFQVENLIKKIRGES